MPGAEAHANSEQLVLDPGDQTCEEAVVQECTAETYVSGDTDESTSGGARRPGKLAWCAWTVLIAIVGSAVFVPGSEARVDNGVSDSGDQTYDVISMLGPEAQVNDGVLESGD